MSFERGIGALQKPSSLLKNTIVELDEEEKHRKSPSYETYS